MTSPSASQFSGSISPLDLKQADAVLRSHAAAQLAGDVGVLQVAGRDARSFLQNLSTNDLRLLAPGDGCEAFFTNHKARAIAHAVITCRRDDDFLITVQSHRAEALFKHLDRHLISEQVELTPLDWSLLRLLGPAAARWIEAGSLQPWQSAPVGETLVRRQAAFHVSGFEIVGPRDAIRGMLDGLRERSLPVVGDQAMDVIRIESGWPKWEHEIDENRFVVELGRTANAISYAKGCYLGQEPIVMARDRGQVNRQLLGFKSEVELPVGTNVMKGEIEQFKVTSCALSPGFGSYVGLAFVYRGAGSAGATLALPGGAEVSLLSLPMVPA